MKKIRLTRHAKDKLVFVRRYGFNVDEATIKETVANPSRIDRRDNQILALKPLTREMAIRVVYELINDNIVVITFYPVKRKRFNV